MRENPVKRKLQAGEASFGALAWEFVTPGLPPVLERGGAEFCIFDMEHSGLSLETMRSLIRWCRSTTVVPLVRVPSHEYRYVAGALDAGAQGLMIPMVESAEQAREIVSWAKYPPAGRRGTAFGCAHDDYRGGDAAAITATMASANTEGLLLFQIETAAGLARVEEILAVEGVDVAWVGHGDLSVSMGLPYQFEHPDHIAALERVAAAARAVGKAAGRMVTDVATGRRWLERGYRMLAYGPETALLARALREGIQDLQSTADGMTPPR
jgi:2-dehydro-3-deoxyglucarate aldolase/4-hydroxy-2-oxoheptanedioate aldolase